jgi:hypothetical protein
MVPFLTTKRKPDIIITSLKAALRAANPDEQNSTWLKVTQLYCPKRPLASFEWFDVLSSLELKFEELVLKMRPKSFGDMPDPTPI